MTPDKKQRQTECLIVFNDGIKLKTIAEGNITIFCSLEKGGGAMLSAHFVSQVGVNNHSYNTNYRRA
jgi:hypothetical protein